MHEANEKNGRLVRLSETGRFWKVAFEELSPAEQVFRSVWELEAEVNNGGFDQYFFNSPGGASTAAVQALQRIGARSAAEIVHRAISQFPGGQPPRDPKQRRSILEAIGVTHAELLEQLDTEFLRYPDDLTELLHSYVVRHRCEIAGSAEVGI